MSKAAKKSCPVESPTTSSEETSPAKKAKTSLSSLSINLQQKQKLFVNNISRNNAGISTLCIRVFLMSEGRIHRPNYTGSGIPPTDLLNPASIIAPTIIGVMIFGIGSLFRNFIRENFIEATDTEEAVRNPIHFVGSQFRYKKTVERTREISDFNSDSNTLATERILALPNRLSANVGCFIGHCCNNDDERVCQLQTAYAELIDMIQTRVPGMPDLMNLQQNGEPKRFTVHRENVFISASGSEVELAEFQLTIKVLAVWVPMEIV